MGKPAFVSGVEKIAWDLAGVKVLGYQVEDSGVLNPSSMVGKCIIFRDLDRCANIQGSTVDGTNPTVKHQMRLVGKIPLFTRFEGIIPAGCLGFQNDQQVQIRFSTFRTIQVKKFRPPDVSLGRAFATSTAPGCW